MAKKVLVPLATGFEEIEAVTIIDVLRRAGVEVITAGVGGTAITGSHALTIQCDTEIGQAAADGLDGMVLPGGMPGAKNLAADSTVRALITALDRAGRLLAAICAAPMVLHAAGALKGRRATCYPSFEKELTESEIVQDPVAADGNVITGRGPAAALAFTLEIAARLAGPARAGEVQRAMLA
jgi:4-methyl-5(b-hydroxyethyl)-thiazole monophosphate biosynthesis